MVDGRATVDNPDNGEASFDSARFEMRQRFAEEGDWPIDIALSAEANTRRLENGHYQNRVWFCRKILPT